MDNNTFKLKYKSEYWLLPAFEIAVALFILAVDLASRSIPDIYLANIAAVLILAFTLLLKDRNGILKRVTIEDEIVLEYYLRRRARFPLGSAVTIRQDSVDLGPLSLSVGEIQNGNEMLEFFSTSAAKGYLTMKREDEIKPTHPQKLKSFLSIVLFAFCFLVPAGYYFFYDRIPYHLLGQRSDTYILILLFMGVAAIIAHFRKKYVKSTADE